MLTTFDAVEAAPSGYVITATGDARTILESTAMPLGIMAEGEFLASPDIDLQSGDVILFTDGVTKALAPDGTAFGIDRALQVLREHRWHNAGELIESLYQAVTDFMGQPVLEDDVTAIIIKVV